MDRRNDAPKESGFLKDLQVEEQEYDDKVEIGGKSYRIPYKTVKEVVFSNVSKEELKDIPYSARLQYRLLLMDSVLKAKIEFIWGRITVVYNPVGADNRKEKISMRELIEFLAKEGVHVNTTEMKERDVDYINEIFKYQFDPASIREHAPYTYTIEQWKRMKAKYESDKEKLDKEKLEKFHKWQNEYLEQHPEIAKEYGYTIPERKPTLKERLFGKKKSDKEKGFWFHGT